ncbi:MAG: class I SAM-dependent methyltransferase [Cyanobacteria bacterium P01_A01_bin.123]
MSFYTQKILPRLLDWSMSGQGMATHRQQLLADVTGKVLEIGFGTGLNLAYYPETVSQLTVIDPNPGMNVIAQRRITQSVIAVDPHLINGEALPMGDRSFDSVVSTWTLCSIANVEQALQEIHRVLKPSGRFFFIEHGLSPEPGVQTWQNRLTPIQKIVADGCHINRPIDALIGKRFELLALERFYEPSIPKVAGYFYKGIAKPN